MRPGPALAAEAAAREVRDDSYLVWRHSEVTRYGVPDAEDTLRRFVEKQRIAFPLGDRAVDLHRVVVLERRDVGVIDAYGRCREAAIDVSPPARPLAA